MNDDPPFVFDCAAANYTKSEPSKTLENERADVETSARIAWGHHLEVVVAKHWKERAVAAPQRIRQTDCISYLISQWGSFVLSAILAAFGRDILANQIEILIVEHNSIVTAAR
jgi:hypothetical protein